MLPFYILNMNKIYLCFFIRLKESLENHHIIMPLCSDKRVARKPSLGHLFMAKRVSAKTIYHSRWWTFVRGCTYLLHVFQNVGRSYYDHALYCKFSNSYPKYIYVGPIYWESSAVTLRRYGLWVLPFCSSRHCWISLGPYYRFLPWF